MPDRRGGAIGRGLVAVAIACAGVTGAPAAAQAAAAETATTTAACSTDSGAQGLASRPVSDSLVSVDRTDGRIAQFQLFYDASATGGLPFVWHREQDAPGGAYGAWRRVSAATVGPKSYYITAMENSAGHLELLFSTYGTFCHAVENGGAGVWSRPEAFGLAPTPYHGGVVLFKERDGSIDAFASGSRTGNTLEVRHQRNAESGWGPVLTLGPVPGQDVGLSQPSTVDQLPDGRLHLTAREWNRDRMWEVYQAFPGGGWDPWHLVAPAQPTTAAPRAVASTDTAAPELNVNRTTGLRDGDIVRFTIAGGPPRDYVWVKECAPSASVTTCDDDTGRQFRVYPDGTYQLSPKKLYAQLATTAGTFDCRTAASGNPCTLALTDNTGALLTTVPLRFAPHAPLEAPPTLNVTPDVGLVDGQAVRATGKGYEPQFHALVMECAGGSADTFGCRPRSRPPATSDSGRLDEAVTLSATFTAIDGRTIDCRAAHACELVVFGTRVRGPETVRHPLAFVPTAPAAPGG
ncbi:neocarzinostatin apoprotein domain-containing protein [Streptomyces sp. ASQP_92]|uniref:neocarzinostatin apoprotein domain-containing protein n=1 Tax=Streptomyces sp. ASQP_92 TaxID=2979116 RepID=UPI0021BE92E6|nr:neocarzinostatin apoprotein domain-containing protein [Streptomyces sp. ASQP_92]MCT9089071.1 neocarzinostatin apoprotein domain-containing protein [Streptomyces sp. ASQP_92]